MATKKEATPALRVAVVDKKTNKIEYKDSVTNVNAIQIVIPEGMTYPQIRKALDFAALRVK
jgi:hypothetical protein